MPKPAACFIIDERQTRERVQMLHRLAEALGEHAQVEVVEGDLSEERLIQKLQADNYSLIVAPWYRYLQWKRVESVLGMARVAGPTFCGYFADQLHPHELDEGCDFTRTILLDFNHLSQAESLRFLTSLLREDQRCGIRPFLRLETPIHSEDWFTGQGLGARADLLLALASGAQNDWKRRANAVRVCVMALWSLIYDEGPGQEQLLHMGGKEGKKATFQYAVDNQACALRLVYTLPGCGPKKLLNEYWPDPARAASASQILQRFSDAVRVHIAPESGEVEVTALLLPSAPSEKYASEVRTLWIEPVAKKLLHSVTDSNIQAVPNLSQTQAPPINGSFEARLKTRERQVAEAQTKIRELSQNVLERDQTIRELKMGGVGVAPQLPPPDAESLIVALQARVRETKTLIQQAEKQVLEAGARQASASEIQRLEEKLVRLTQREQEIVLKLETAVESFRELRSGKRRQSA